MKALPLLLAILASGCIEKDRRRAIHNLWPEPMKVVVDWTEEWDGLSLPVHEEHDLDAGDSLVLSFLEDELPASVVVIRRSTGEWIYSESWDEGDFRHDVWLTPPE